MSDKIDIFSLFKEEKRIAYKLDDGKELVLLLVKPAQETKEKVFEAMSKTKDEILYEIRENPVNQSNLDQIVKSYSLEGKIEFVLGNEEIQQNQMSDLFPVGDRESMTKEEMEKAEKDFLAQWREKRTVELQEMNETDLSLMVRNILVESRAIIAAGETYSKQMMLHCVMNEDRKNTFKSISEVGKLDSVIFNWLRSEIDSFIAMLSQKQVRQAVQDKGFLSPIESVKSTTDSTTTPPVS